MIEYLKKKSEMKQRLEVFRKYEPECEIDMVNCGYEKCIPHFSNTTMRPYYLLHFVIDGEGQLIQKGNEYNLSAGTLFTIYPDNVVSYFSTNPDNSLYFCWIGLSGHNVCSLLGKLGLTVDNPVINLLNIYEIYQIICQLTETVHENRSTSPNYIKSRIYMILYSIEKKMKAEGPGLKNSKHTNYLAWSIAAYIEYNCTGKINIQKVADIFNINRTYMWKIFKTHVGLSPKTHLINCRISRAKSLMQNTDKTIKDIASSCGLPDICHFHKLFTQYEGVTPGQYLRSVKSLISKVKSQE